MLPEHAGGSYDAPTVQRDTLLKTVLARKVRALQTRNVQTVEDSTKLGHGPAPYEPEKRKE